MRPGPVKIETIPTPFVYGEIGNGVTVTGTYRAGGTIRLFFDDGNSITETVGTEFVARRRSGGRIVYVYADPPRDR